VDNKFEQTRSKQEHPPSPSHRGNYEGLSPQKRKLLELLLKEKGVKVSSAQKAAAIPRRDQQGFLPLGLNQEGLWFLDQMDPGKGHYNIPATVRLHGRLDVAALEQSLSEIVRRHETLRTTFAMSEEGTPCQIIAPPPQLTLPLIDLRELPPSQRAALARRLATESAQRPMNLAQGPLFDAQLLRLAEEEHALLLNLHHIVADGWSMGIFTRELRVLYQAFLRGESSPLPELPIQFADFAVWQREQMQRENFQAQLAYWKQQLSGALPVLQLPTDRPRPQVQSFRGRHQAIKLSKSLTGALRTLAQREEVTLFITLLAAFKVLLYRYSEQDEIVVGSTFANRNQRELQGSIGFFVNTLPLRTKLSGDLSFRDLLRRVREVALGASAHQELPLAKLVQELQPERDSSRNPFYQVVFDLLTPDHNPAVYGYGLSSGANEALEFAGLKVTPLEVEYEIARFDLAVFIWDLPAGLHGAFEYSTDLFEPATIARMAENFETLIDRIVGEPEVRLHVLVEYLNAREQQQRISQERAYQEAVHQKLRQIKRRPMPQISPSESV